MAIAGGARLVAGILGWPLTVAIAKLLLPALGAAAVSIALLLTRVRLLALVPGLGLRLCGVATLRIGGTGLEVTLLAAALSGADDRDTVALALPLAAPAPAALRLTHAVRNVLAGILARISVSGEGWWLVRVRWLMRLHLGHILI
jgi:hypothetical protein